jgi:hypothetical protein
MLLVTLVDPTREVLAARAARATYEANARRLRELAGTLDAEGWEGWSSLVLRYAYIAEDAAIDEARVDAGHLPAVELANRPRARTRPAAAHSLERTTCERPHPPQPGRGPDLPHRVRLPLLSLAALRRRRGISSYEQRLGDVLHFHRAIDIAPSDGRSGVDLLAAAAGKVTGVGADDRRREGRRDLPRRRVRDRVLPQRLEPRERRAAGRGGPAHRRDGQDRDRDRDPRPLHPQGRLPRVGRDQRPHPRRPEVRLLGHQQHRLAAAGPGSTRGRTSRRT